MVLLKEMGAKTIFYINDTLAKIIMAKHFIPRWHILSKKKYEIFLFALFQHLFMGLFITDLEIYRNYFWPASMLILALSSFGIIREKTAYLLKFLWVLVFFIMLSPILAYIYDFSPMSMVFKCTCYAIFFLFILYEVMDFMLRPSYFNADIISACACGYLMLIEICGYISQIIYYLNNQSFSGIDSKHHISIFIDFVYFSTVTITSIGFGDVTPSVHYTKLLASLFGIIGQFYSIVLFGILINKFASKKSKE